MLIKSDLWVLKNNSDNCSVWEYPKISSNLGCAKATINGRYPDKGKQVVNFEVEQIYFVIAWTWMIYSENWEFEINKGDIYHFNKWEKYYVVWKKLNILLINSPEWFPEQAGYVDM